MSASTKWVTFNHGNEIVTAGLHGAQRFQRPRSLADTLASYEDRNWFAANPTRHYRLRGPLSEQHGTAVVVHQIMPGLRRRLVLTLTRALETFPDDEATAKRLWVLAMHGLPIEARRHLQRENKILRGMRRRLNGE